MHHQFKDLNFRIADVRMHITAALGAEFRHPAPEDLYNPEVHFGKKVQFDTDGLPNPHNVDWSRVPPALWLVSDMHGVSLMANAQFDDGVVLPPVPENGCRGDYNTSHRRAVELFGHDVLCIAIPTRRLREAMRPGMQELCIRVFDRELSAWERLKSDISVWAGGPLYVGISSKATYMFRRACTDDVHAIA